MASLVLVRAAPTISRCRTASSVIARRSSTSRRSCSRDVLVATSSPTWLPDAARSASMLFFRVSTRLSSRVRAARSFSISIAAGRSAPVARSWATSASRRERSSVSRSFASTLAKGVLNATACSRAACSLAAVAAWATRAASIWVPASGCGKTWLACAHDCRNAQEELVQP